MKKYIALRNFASMTSNGTTKAGEMLTLPEKIAEKMMSKGLIAGGYETKEHKEAAKVTIELSSPGWYTVMHGKKEIGKMRKKEAEAYKKKHE